MLSKSNSDAEPPAASSGNSDESSGRGSVAEVPLAWLTGAGFVLGIIYAAIILIWMAPKDAIRSDVLWVVGLYAVASAVWLFAIRFALRVDGTNRTLFSVILVFAVCFRAIQMFGTPIMELDVYRYMWDGIVASHGSSPYQFSPGSILATDVVIADPELQRVTEIAAMSPAHHEILSTVHFPEYTTIYPPVSQAVFGAAMWLVPDQASASTHLLAMRLALLLFDMLTLVAVFRLIQLAGMHVGWLIGYAWNPLVIKEVANSAHVDVIAASLTAMALFVVLKSQTKLQLSALAVLGAATLMVLAVGAKLYPVVLAPVVFLVFAKRSFRHALLFSAVFVGASVFLLSWMIPSAKVVDAQNDPVALCSKAAPADAAPANDVTVSVSADQQNGLAGFLSRWRMNDLAFSLVYENVKLRGADSESSNLNRPWYSVLPDSWREPLLLLVGGSGQLGSPEYRFARIVTLSLFVLIAAWLLFGMWRSPPDNRLVLRTSFGLLVAFLLLQPTLNPWYCLWVLPFACFVHNRGWLLFAPALFCYYLRFWFKATNVDFALGSFTYRGVGVFDHCLVWLEYAVIGLSLLVGYWYATTREPTMSNTC